MKTPKIPFGLTVFGASILATGAVIQHRAAKANAIKDEALNNQIKANHKEVMDSIKTIT